MSKRKSRRYYLIYYGSGAIVFVISIPFALIFSDIPLFVIIVFIIIALIYISSCYAVYKKGYINVPPQITFPLVKLGKNGINSFKGRVSTIKKEKRRRK
jgi:uncharacterized membrane protein YdbT with pleckstrin-like domain